jgi:hypothetical protein
MCADRCASGSCESAPKIFANATTWCGSKVIRLLQNNYVVDVDQCKTFGLRVCSLARGLGPFYATSILPKGWPRLNFGRRALHGFRRALTPGGDRRGPPRCSISRKKRRAETRGRRGSPCFPFSSPPRLRATAFAGAEATIDAEKILLRPSAESALRNLETQKVLKANLSRRKPDRTLRRSAG